MPKMEMGYSMSFKISNRRYLGSKAKLIDFIVNTINNECEEIKSFADVFAGTGNVAWAFNKKETKIIVNDIMKSNYFSYIAFFGKEKVNNNKLLTLIEYYNNVAVSENNYFSLNFSNTYFNEENCKKIGFIREDIEKRYQGEEINEREKCILITSLLYAMDRIANTCGHYDAFILNGQLNKELKLEMLEIANFEQNILNEIYCEDTNALVKKIDVDMVYIDPPYNSRQYCDAYHLLENVATWTKPEVHGVARKMDRTHLKSKYCSKSAPKQFMDLIENINSKYILVSYNNMGTKGAGRSQAKITDDEIIAALSKRGLVKIFETDFNQFTTGKTNIENHKERLFLCIVGKESKAKIQIQSADKGFVKSPLNYTGGKYKLLPQLFEKFPKKFDTFVDLFGGGFNVGVNVDCETVIYNEKIKEVAKIIKLLKKYQSYEVIRKIDDIIRCYNLSNSYENGYDFYNCNSENGLGHYNKKHYEKLREDYNKIVDDNDYKYFMLLTLIIFSFNNQVRFNKNGEFNMPVGKRDFNSNTRKNLIAFISKINRINLKVHYKDFEKINFKNMKNAFVYCDPPYFLGMASYNEADGWSIYDEKRLLSLLVKLDENGIKFALSNVVEHKGQTHQLLKDWVEENHFNLIYLKANYSNSNYQLKNKDSITREVLITNY